MPILHPLRVASSVASDLRIELASNVRPPETMEESSAKS
jgi:hypothetical protein